MVQARGEDLADGQVAGEDAIDVEVQRGTREDEGDAGVGAARLEDHLVVAGGKVGDIDPKFERAARGAADRGTGVEEAVEAVCGSGIADTQRGIAGARRIDVAAHGRRGKRERLDRRQRAGGVGPNEIPLGIGAGVEFEHQVGGDELGQGRGAEEHEQNGEAAE
jgi:hypothetical protein